MINKEKCELVISDDILWISCSDFLLATFAPIAEALTELQTLKGWFFLSCTSLLLYGLISRGIQRKQVEEALRENERRFKAVFNQQFQFMAILKPDGTVIEVNDTCLRVTSVSAERVLGVRFWETPWFNQIPLMQERLQQSIAEVAIGSSSPWGRSRVFDGRRDDAICYLCHYRTQG
ncbi:diguanylate cyclase with PAS/PAC and GAF sensors (plasmid) [Anabaenopsis circularis NIES-21]|uniref:Diguanylate cyclase with PAS/PAC and GAF sensors n=1 Tax=Anabaenopsis circularis NIES-21 TaxID=1085406 RepID=A0A1Z4GR90_9CYAN|nr:diguanylate cyclase with PAS/PAC and GAF sensors [Anabaenopsis circularis NIES-21]